MTTTQYDELMAAPEGEDATAAPNSVIRATATYESHDDRFKIQKKNFERQYAQLYYYRLMKLRPVVLKQAAARWPGVPVVSILNLPEDDDAEVVVAGTIYKEMALKPSILDEYDKDRALKQHLGRTHFTQADDKLVLEDEGARITLTSDVMLPKDYVTGIVLAVKGRVQPNGDFLVNDVGVAGLPTQPPRATTSKTTNEQDKYVAIVSGLGIGEDTWNPLRLQMLVDYLTGALGSTNEQTFASKVVRLIIAGGIFGSAAQEALSQPTAYSAIKQQVDSTAPLREADIALTELSSCMPIDVMPGASDPANFSLPQQPLHPCLFPGAASYNTFNSCTNPHYCTVDGVSFLGTSGQNVDDVARYSDIGDRHVILQRVLEWRHLIPTAPDTLAAYPFYDADPFIVEEAPRVAFAGCQPRFETAVVESGGGDGGEETSTVRVIAVPYFSKTGCVVFVNLRTLEVQPMYFDIEVMKE